MAGDERLPPPALPGENVEAYRKRLATSPYGVAPPTPPAPPPLPPPARSSTDDAVSVLGIDGKRVMAWAKVTAAAITMLATALITAITTYRTATADAKVQVQATKDKSEAGYQVTRQAIEAIDHRIAALEEAIRRRELAEAPKPAHKPGAHPPAHRPASAPPLPLVVTPAPKALPGNLDQAERQIYKRAPAAPAAQGPPGPDASP